MFSAVSRRSRPAALEYVSEATQIFISKRAESQSLQLVGASGFGSSLVLRSYEKWPRKARKSGSLSPTAGPTVYIALFHMHPAALFDME